MEIRTNKNLRRNKIEILHGPEEAAAPPIAFMSVSALSILNSALSAYTPPKKVWFNVAGNYRLTPFATNMPGALAAITACISVTGYLDGSFDKVQLAAGTEVASASAAYFCW